MAQVYAAMSPEELQEVADDGAWLTNKAGEAPKAISGRGLDITVNEVAPGVDVIERRDLARRFGVSRA